MTGSPVQQRPIQAAQAPQRSAVIGGIIPPVPTPLAAGGTVDEAAIERLCRHVIEGGVSGVFALGTTGELASLSQTARARCCSAFARAVDGRARLIVGVTGCAIDDVGDNINAAADAGAEAVSLMPPYYFPPTQAELRTWMLQIADRSRLPIVLYNYPFYCKCSIDIETVADLMQHERIIGIKDSSGDDRYLASLLEIARGRGDFAVLLGGERNLVDLAAQGLAGAVSGAAVVMPREVVACWEAARSGDVSGASSLAAGFGGLFEPPSPLNANIVFKQVKFAAHLLGLCSAQMAPPLHTLADDAAARLAVRLWKRGLIPVVPSATEHT